MNQNKPEQSDQYSKQAWKKTELHCSNLLKYRAFQFLSSSQEEKKFLGNRLNMEVVKQLQKGSLSLYYHCLLLAFCP